MHEAIYLKTGAKVKAWLNPESGEDWYLIEFENGASICVYKDQIELLP